MTKLFRPGAPAIMHLQLMAFAVPADEEIRRKAGEVVSRPDYDLNSGVDPLAQGLLSQLLRWILTPLQWLFNALEGIPDALRWVIVVVLVLIAVALTAHIVWSFVQALKGPRQRRSLNLPRTATITPEEMEQAALMAEQQGNYIEAVRRLFVACLLRIQRSEKKTFRKGFTNLELLRRYRNSPLYEPLRHFVVCIDRTWYGQEVCREQDYRDCQEQHQQICGIVERRTYAVGS